MVHTSLLGKWRTRSHQGIAAMSAILLSLTAALCQLIPQLATATMPLVNTESFQVIDAGDGTTNIELKFGPALNARLYYDVTSGRFILTKNLQVQGNITATGSVYVNQTIVATGSIISKGVLSGQTLRASNNAAIHGALAVSGAVKTDSNITINDDADSNDAVLTFGNTSGNQTLTFINANQLFKFSKGINVVGAISGTTVHGSSGLTTSGALSVEGAATFQGGVTFLSTVSLPGAGTLTAGTLSGGQLIVSGNARVGGALAVTGAIKTDGNLTINDDADSNNAVLTFGNTSGNQALTFNNTTQTFTFSKGINVAGGISGSSLRIDNNASIYGNLSTSGSITSKGTISGRTLVISGASSFSGAALFRTNVTAKGSFSGSALFGAGLGDCNNASTSKLIYNATTGKFSCATDSTTAGGGSSGNILSLHPEYPNHVYFYSGSSYIGQLTASGGNAGQYENFYHWTTSKATIQDYWISVRVRIPDNFSSWDPVKALQLRYRTKVGGPASVSTNHLTLRIIDSAGAVINGTGSLTNTAFTTANIPLTTGTWTPQTYITVLIKLATTSSGFAEADYLNFNWENIIP